jgi:hypothetical protein
MIFNYLEIFLSVYMARDCIEMARNDFCAKMGIRVTPIVEEERLVQVVFWCAITMSALRGAAM